MIIINDIYYIDTDMDYGYLNSWLGHKKYYYGLYKKEDNITRKIREYKTLDGVCDSLLSKFNKGSIDDISIDEIRYLINYLIKSEKIKRRVNKIWQKKKNKL